MRELKKVCRIIPNDNVEFLTAYEYGGGEYDFTHYVKVHELLYTIIDDFYQWDIVRVINAVRYDYVRQLKHTLTLKRDDFNDDYMMILTKYDISE